MAIIKNPLTVIKGGSEAETEEKTVDLDLSSGNQVVTPTDGLLLKEVVITKPDTLTADNIKSGVTIAGVTGIFEGEATGDLPQLNAVTIYTSNATLRITNPTTNGNFVTGYKIYINGEYFDTSATVTYDLQSLSGLNRVSVSVTAIGNNFFESNQSNSVNYFPEYSITTNLLNTLGAGQNPNVIKNYGTAILNFSATEGYFLPNGVSVSNASFVWDSGTGTLTLSNPTGNVTVEIIASSNKPFAQYSWEEIADIANNGHAESFFNLGDTKELYINDNLSLNMQIIGFNHDELSDGSGYANITLRNIASISQTVQMNTKATNTGEWGACQGRTYLNSTFFNLLPTLLKNNIKEVKKAYITSSNSVTPATSNDKIFMISIGEFLGRSDPSLDIIHINSDTKNSYISNEGTQYELYKNAPIPSNCRGLEYINGAYINVGSFTSTRSAGTTFTNFFNVNMTVKYGGYISNYYFGVTQNTWVRTKSTNDIKSFVNLYPTGAANSYANTQYAPDICFCL